MPADTSLSEVWRVYEPLAWKFLLEYEGLRNALVDYLTTEIRLLKAFDFPLDAQSWPNYLTVRTITGRSEIIQERDKAYETYEIQRKLLGGPSSLDLAPTTVRVRA